MQSQYELFKQQHEKTPERLHHFDLHDEHIVEEFTHWVIIKNRFPYDNMVSRNDLLLARDMVTNLYEATEEAQHEFHSIMRKLAERGAYDAKIENFPNATSAKSQFHVHLVVWHNHGTNT